MRYFDFVIEVCEWREDRIRGDEPTRPEQRAQELFGENNPRHREHLDVLLQGARRVGG